VRVYRRIEYPHSWELFTAPPEGAMPPYVSSFWIGHCSSSNSPLTPSGSLALCKSYVVNGDVAVNYTMSAQNLTKTDRVRKYLSELASQWQEKRTVTGRSR